MSADEVAAMYSKTIKMATEGKINAKNAWNLPLIDHMRDVVKGEDSTDKKRPQRAVNFQKASCTIEAGMKIYCSRVDDTLTTSYRVLESLHRGKDETNEDDDSNEPNENDDEQTQAKKARKKKEKRRGDAASTLASLDQIDAVDVDEAATDVLFSRLSRSGGGGLTDGTSARAMLLLRLAAEGACVSFGDSGAVDDGQDDAVVHVQPLRDLLPTVPTEFCPALSQLRREVEDGVDHVEAPVEDEGGFLAGADDDDDGCRFDDGDDVGGDLEGALDAALNDTAGGLGAAAAVNGELDATAAFALVSGALARAGDANFFDAARLAVFMRRPFLPSTRGDGVICTPAFDPREHRLDAVDAALPRSRRLASTTALPRSPRRRRRVTDTDTGAQRLGRRGALEGRGPTESRPEGRPGEEEEAHRHQARVRLRFWRAAAFTRRARAAAAEAGRRGPARAGPGGAAAVACRRARPGAAAGFAGHAGPAAEAVFAGGRGRRRGCQRRRGRARRFR